MSTQPDQTKSPRLQKIIGHYNALAGRREAFLKKNAYYHNLINRQYRYFIPEGKKVLEVGCGTGDLLNAVKPSQGWGVDVSDWMIALASKKYPRLKLTAGTITDLPDGETFDYIILSGIIGELEDVQDFFTRLKRFCRGDTRIIIEYYSYLWLIGLRVAERLRLKMPQQILNWLTPSDVKNFLTLAGFETVTTERRILMPVYIPVLSALVNRLLGNLPLINAFAMNYFLVARPQESAKEERSVSIVIPCRNEKGNIENAVRRTPAFGTHQEFVFVEGGSLDGTYEETVRVKNAHPDKDIKILKQTGKGKGDAMRLGFAQAQGDVLMILDADLTVAPEDLPKFYRALVENKGEFINGCRLVYPLEKQAMRFLNLVANKMFSVFFSWLLGQGFKDTLCGTKVLRKDRYDEIVRNRGYFGDFDPFGDFDLIFGASKLNLKVVELPVRYYGREYGQTQIRRFYHGLLLIKMCFFAMRKIKFRR